MKTRKPGHRHRNNSHRIWMHGTDTFEAVNMELSEAEMQEIDTALVEMDIVGMGR